MAVVGGLEFREVVSVTRLDAGIADNVIPGEATATLNLRYPPDRTPAEAESYLASLVPDGATLDVVSNAAAGRVVVDSPRGPCAPASRRPRDRAEAGVDERRGLHGARPRRRQLRPGAHGASRTTGTSVSRSSALVPAYEVLGRFLTGPMGEDAA